MKQLMKATIYRMYKATGIRIAILLTWMAATGYFLCSKWIANGTLASTAAGSITALGDGMIIWLFASISVGILVASDFENKTIHGAIGYGRNKIIINYFIIFIGIMLLMVLPYTIGSLVYIISDVSLTGAEGTMISIYMGNVFEYTEENTVFQLILSYLSYALIYMGQLSVCIPVAIRFPKPIVVTSFGFFFGMITAFISTIASKVEMLDNIYKLTPYAYGIKQLGVDASPKGMWMGMGASILFIGLMLLISWMVFRKADIK